VDLPRIRAIEPSPAEGDRFYLRDPERFSDSVLLVPRAALLVISLLDGTRSIVDVQAAFARATGEILYRENVEEIISALDKALFLDNERFRSAQAEVIRSFHASEVREATHAGLSYHAGGAELAGQLGELLAGAGAEAARAGHGTSGDLEAIVAPHIDLARGGEAYGAIYRELALRCRASRFVVLGICHHPTVHAFALCRKDFDTPLGRVSTDRGLVDELVASCSTDFLADEIAHRDEHSIEFQLLFLQYLFGGHSELCGMRDFRVVPILCSSFRGRAEESGRPCDSGEVAELLGALRRALGPRSEDCLIAAVDFAHLGRQFGQELEVTDRVVADAEADDRRMMERIAARDAEGFYSLIATEKDARNVCGVPALYSMLHLLGPGPDGAVARYGQAVDRTNHSIVSFAGIAFERAWAR
jgi:MEMO1 family protein